jgi:phosphoribosylaminoimidazolecarboxamide formyltransferase/IMP cyclohydrolase
MITVHPSTAEAARADVKITRALISVYDKRGLIPLARGLAEHGVELVATGGTATILTEAGLQVVPVENLTGYPEMLDGRVKSLHPAIHAGILFQRHLEEHERDIAAHGIKPIDLVVGSLYPFAEARARAAGIAELVEFIDVGGPTMVRAAAKNFAHVAVVTSSHQYEPLLAELRARGGFVSGATRLRLAAEAFATLAAYDGAVAQSLAGLAAGDVPGAAALPSVLALGARRERELRYGENPHQKAAFYVEDGEAGLAAAAVHQGKELSYTNLLDLDAALLALVEFPGDSCVVVKHASPSGLGVAATPVAAFRLARDGDPLSAFGGVIGSARIVDGETAAEITHDFYEVVVAPGFTPEALALFAKKPALRVVSVPPPALERAMRRPRLRSILGGYLVEEPDLLPAGAEIPGDVVTRRAPTPEEKKALLFAFKVAKLVRSNAIVIARGDRTLGIGGGQASRIDAVEVAAMKAARSGHDVHGAVLASDAFFPFPDAVESAGRLGITAIVQPGGSKRDADAIAAADRLEIAMVFTGERHFVH